MNDAELRERIREHLIALWEEAQDAEDYQEPKHQQPMRRIGAYTDQIMALIAIAHPNTNHVHSPAPGPRAEETDAE